MRRSNEDATSHVDKTPPSIEVSLLTLSGPTTDTRIRWRIKASEPLREFKIDNLALTVEYPDTTESGCVCLNAWSRWGGTDEAYPCNDVAPVSFTGCASPQIPCDGFGYDTLSGPYWCDVEPGCAGARDARLHDGYEGWDYCHPSTNSHPGATVDVRPEIVEVLQESMEYILEVNVTLDGRYGLQSPAKAFRLVLMVLQHRRYQLQ